MRQWRRYFLTGLAIPVGDPVMGRLHDCRSLVLEYIHKRREFMVEKAGQSLNGLADLLMVPDSRGLGLASEIWRTKASLRIHIG